MAGTAPPRRWNGWGDPDGRGGADAPRKRAATVAHRVVDAARGCDARGGHRGGPGQPPRGRAWAIRGSRRTASVTPAARACRTGSRSAPGGSPLSPTRSRGPPTPTDVRALLRPGAGAWLGARPVRRRHERRRRRDDPTLRPAGRLGGSRGPVRAAIPRRDQRTRHVRGGHDRPGHRGRAGRARPHAGPLSAVVRVLDARRLGGGSVGRAGVDRLRADRAVVRGRPRRDAGGAAGPAPVPGVGGRARPARARPGFGGPPGHRHGCDRSDRATTPARPGPGLHRPRLGRGPWSSPGRIAQAGLRPLDGPRVYADRDGDDPGDGRRRPQPSLAAAVPRVAAPGPGAVPRSWSASMGPTTS